MEGFARRARRLAAPPLAVAALLLSGCIHRDVPDAAHAEPAPPARLTRLAVSGAGELAPAFSPNTFHYAVRCQERQTLTIAAAAEHGAIHLDGAAGESVERTLNVSGDADIILELGPAPGAPGNAVYVVHCLPPAFPDIALRRAETAPAAAERGLLLVSPYYNHADTGESVSYIALFDGNGVPRFHRRTEKRASNFRWHPDAGVYSYAAGAPNTETRIVLLDEQLVETQRLNTVAGIAGLTLHDFLITDEGNRIFLAYNPSMRDLRRYPDSDGALTHGSREATRDSVIQEVSPDGREVFRWDSYDHVKLSDCMFHRFPDDYAHINSVQVVGNALVVSLRGCSQVLKIDRKSGRVLWQVGGTDPAAADAHDERRPTFRARRHLAIEGDPHGGFCAQHSATYTARGTLLLFDNGRYCPPGIEEHPTRIVEYRIDGRRARFLRHHQPDRHPTIYGGSVELQANGNWLAAWGGGPNVTVTEVAPGPDRTEELFSLTLSKGAAAAWSYRVYRAFGLTPPLRR